MTTTNLKTAPSGGRPDANIRRLLGAVPPGVALLVAMTLFMWRFALIGRHAMIHGDSISFALPLFQLRGWVAAGHASALWTNTVYGGHPIFAEGQGAFASVLPMVLAAVVTPLAGAVYTENLFPVLYLILTAIGVYGLGRSLGLSRSAATIAAFAVAYSPLWLDLQSNYAVGGTFMWVPWSLWAMEVWVKRPSVRSGALMGLALANMIVAGYAQGFHGTVIYMTASLLPLPFAAEARRTWLITWRSRLGSGALAVLVCAGLAAIQLVPLMELVGLSHRAGGTAILFNFGPRYVLRGLLFTLNGDLMRLNSYPSVGCLLVCVLASAAPLLGLPWRLAGHAIAALVLVLLGMGPGSAIFRFVYAHDLVPGLHYLRGVSLYIAIGAVGLGILAGAASDRIAARAGVWIRPTRLQAVGAMLFIIAWIWGIERLHTPGAPPLQFTVVGVAAITVILLARLNKAAAIPVALAGLLIVECLALRLEPLRLGDPSLIAEPGSVKAIEALPDWQDYKVIDESAAAAYAFQNSRSDVVPSGVTRMLSSMTCVTPLLWGIHSMDGEMALPLARRLAVKSLIEDEIAGRSATQPGARLMDILGIRFISMDSPDVAFRRFWHEDGAVWVMENTAALPRFQAYARHVTVDSSDAALDVIAHWGKPVLVIENPPGMAHQDEMPDGSEGEGPPPTFQVDRAEPTEYRLTVSAQRPGWLFLADADYPGWTATLDGRRAPLFAAQMLGKAVAVPSGQHIVTIEFHSASFRLGAWISAGALVVTLIALLFGAKVASSPPQLVKERS